MAAAKTQDFEKAAAFRDKMFALEETLEKQVSVATDFKDRDILAVAGSQESSLITALFVRGGYLLGTRHFTFSEILSSDEELIGAFIRQYYATNHFIPQEILVSIPLEDAVLLGDWLGSIKGKRVKILWPQKGERARLVKMATWNAENRLKDLITAAETKADILARLQKRLKMARTPERIECFDNSSISGAEPVAAMVVFEKGIPKKSSYRKYKIRTITAPDDYAYLAEALKRRYSKEEADQPYPDLLIVDGGRGQLNIAVSMMKALHLEGKFELIGIAKKDEKKGESKDKVYQAGRVNPVTFDREGDLLLFLQQIRDEAHRFAISFHRKRRSMATLRSALDTIPGIGAKRKKTLLQHFGSIQKIRAATLDELSVLPGLNRKLAEAVQKALAAA